MTQTLPTEQAYGARRARAAAGRRRILFAVHSAKLGGAERMALLEAESLGSGFELLLSVPDGPLRSRFAEHGEILEGAATLPLWGASAQRWARSVAGTLRDAIAMARLIRRRDVDVVLTNSSVCLAPVLAARLARVPVAVHARDVPKSRLAPLVMALHGKLADTVIVIADGLAPYFRAGHRTRLVRIADGITVPELVPSQASVDFGPSLRLCLVGAIDPRKGQDVAIAALAKLHRRGVSATLDLVGRELDAEFARAVREQAHDLGVSQQVTFVGEVEDAGPHMDRAHLVIAPSRGEWTPLVLMEALARGKPVVAARVGSVAEVVRDREAGLLVAPESPTELAEAIVELSSDPAEALEMAVRGHGHMAANFRVEQTLEGLRREIDRLLDRESVGPAREPRPLQTVL